MLLKKLTRYIKEKKGQGENIIVHKFQGDLESPEFGRFKPVNESQKADIIEGSDKKLKTKLIEIESEKSGFTYFLDGIERKRILFYYNFIPITYGYIAAVIMKRTDKKMHTVDLEDAVENIYLPYREKGDEPEFYFKYEDFSQYGFKPFNIGTKKKQKKSEEPSEYPIFPAEFEQRAHSAIQESRRKTETSLAKKWLKIKSDNDDWLFVDGGLTSISDELVIDSKVVGIIKSHHVQYFNYEEQCKIYNLKKGERSSVFQPLDENRDKKDVFSWYLRLQESKSGNVDFGIIRVEIPAKEEMLNLVDKISNWILLEKNPLSFPDSRWDRMIYPIKCCEDYLKSKAPSWTMIESIL